MRESVRRFWFNNEPGKLIVGGRAVTRKEIFRYGGPAPDLDGCLTCQRTEWFSRLDQADRFQPHKCGTAKTAKHRCSMQGDPLWTNFHQDHFFCIGVDPKLRAPKAALLLRECASQHKWFLSRPCSAGLATFRQKMALTGTCNPDATRFAKWADYNWCWLVNKGEIELFPKPPVPMVLYCHDAWRSNKQEVLDHFRPEVIATPFPTLWQENFNFPADSEMVFTPPMQAPFFYEPNLDDSKKKWDLLVIGALGSHFYAPRRELNEHLKALPSRFTVEHSHEVGSHRARWMGPLDDKHHCYMNKWIEKLGAARFVIFGPCGGKAASMILIKYYECLASGAIPIMPDLKDLELLGVHRMVHFFPLDIVQDNIKALEYILDHYADYRYLAENAVEWWRDNVDELLYGTFEKMVRKITGYKYPPRLLEG